MKTESDWCRNEERRSKKTRLFLLLYFIHLSSPLTPYLVSAAPCFGLIALSKGHPSSTEELNEGSHGMHSPSLFCIDLSISLSYLYILINQMVSFLSSILSSILSSLSISLFLSPSLSIYLCILINLISPS